MRRIAMTLATLLALASVLLSACGSDFSSTEPPGTPEAAPTIAGTSIDVEVPATALQAEAVMIGSAVDELIALHALPGEEQPVISQIRPGTRIELLDAVFVTEDGQRWWQVQTSSEQGWVPARVAYRGPSVDITNQITNALGTPTFSTVEDASAVIGQQVAETQTGSTVVHVATNEIPGTGSVTLSTDVLLATDQSPEDNPALRGYRLTIALGSAGAGLQIASVTQSPLCDNGVATTGSCL